MPPRRKPTSQNAKKASQKLKKAIKRGDVEAPEVVANKKKPNHKRARLRIGPAGEILGSAGNTAVIESSRKLQSSFIKLPPQFLEITKELASTLKLPRPIPATSAFFIDVDPSEQRVQSLSCPSRPKWNFEMTKKQVESNEEALYAKWMSQMDTIAADWQNAGQPPAPNKDEEVVVESPTDMPRSATYFERNIEVWRQLWRVTEISQIILVLLDSRCPLLHYPPSLHAYLSSRTDLRTILVLTKVDIAGQEKADAWTSYFESKYPGTRVVQVESYAEKAERAGHQGRKMYEPRLPEGFRERLVDAIRAVHEEMLEPPEKVKKNKTWLEKWKPPVKQDIAWQGVIEAGGDKVGSAVGGATAPKPKQPEISQENLENVEVSHEYQEPEFLTIGLIGQPNVGKSSLLNALFNTHKVRASKTPGKTKHFQTLFWTHDVRLVDCPGLVFPNLVNFELQVLAGILPISRVSAVPSCIHYAAKLIPLEKVYNLTHPNVTAPIAEDKRTWRDGQKPSSNNGNLSWHAMDILTAYADSKGWVTAKAGRPDVHRAGNAILRSLAEARVPWAFLPPNTTLTEEVVAKVESDGIWLHRTDHIDDSSEDESDINEEPAQESDSEVSSQLESGMESEVEGPPTSGMFAALGMLEEDGEAETSSEKSDGDDDESK